MEQDSRKYIYVTAGENLKKGDLVHVVDGQAFRLEKDYSLLHILEPAFEPRDVKHNDEL